MKTYRVDEIEAGLTMLAAYGGSARPASKALREQGRMIGESTLRSWRDKQYPGRYQAILEKVQNELEPIVLEQTRDAVAKSYDAALDAIRLEHERILKGEVKDAAASAQKLAVAHEKIAQTQRLLLDKPTQIVQTNGDEAVKALDDFLGRYEHVLDDDAFTQAG